VETATASHVRTPRRVEQAASQASCKPSSRPQQCDAAAATIHIIPYHAETKANTRSGLEHRELECRGRGVVPSLGLQHLGFGPELGPPARGVDGKGHRRLGGNRRTVGENVVLDALLGVDRHRRVQTKDLAIANKGKNEHPTIPKVGVIAVQVRGRPHNTKQCILYTQNPTRTS